MVARKAKKEEIFTIDPDFKCDKCKLSKCTARHILPVGNKEGTILFIGDMPETDDENSGAAFMGPRGMILKKMLEKVGIDPKSIYLTNTVMCKTPQDRAPNNDEITACKPYIKSIIKEMPNLKYVVPMGVIALYSCLRLKDLTSKRGSIIEKDGIKYFPTYNPTTAMANDNARELFINDLTLLSNLLEGKIEYGKYKLIDNLELFNIVIKSLEANEVIAVDIETDNRTEEDFSNFVRDNIIGISLSWRERTGVYIPLLSEGNEVWNPDIKQHIIESLSKVLTTPGKKLVLHNGKFDAAFLKKAGIDITQKYKVDGRWQQLFFFDTFLAASLLDETSSHTLDFLVKDYPDLVSYDNALEQYKISWAKEHKMGNRKLKDYGKIPMEIMYKYAATDADATLRLFNKYYPMIEEQGLHSLMYDIVMPLVITLAETEYRGIVLDVNKVLELKREYEIKIEQAIKDFKKEAGVPEDFNINSSKQMGELLYDKLKLTPKTMTEKGAYCVDAKALSKLKHAAVDALMRYRDLDKEYTTYILAFLSKPDKSGALHPTFNIAGTETGRISCAQPNIQNIPRGSTMRKLFISRPGYSFIISDYSQIELRVEASVSQDPGLTQAFWNGIDIHEAVAREIFNVPAGTLVTKEQRTIAKGINFGLIYGRGARSLAEELKITEEQAQEYISNYFKKFAGVTKYNQEQIAYAKQHKCVRTIFGRIRHLAEIDAADKGIRAGAERKAMNTPVQGTAADCTNKAASRLYDYFKEHNLDATLVNHVHDELVIEVKNEQIPQAMEAIYNIMRYTAEEALKLPVLVDQLVSYQWYEPDPGKEPDEYNSIKAYGDAMGVTEEFVTSFINKYVSPIYPVGV